MNYNGKELVEMTRANWDGKTRAMLVWNNLHNAPEFALVIGWSLNIFNSVVWRTIDGKDWYFCAEIPKEESKEESIEDLKEQVERLKAENEKLKETNKSLRVERSEMAENRLGKNGLIEKLKELINSLRVGRSEMTENRSGKNGLIVKLPW